MPDAPVTSSNRPLRLVPVEAMPRARSDGRLADRPPVHQKHIQPAIVIEVEEQRAGSHGLDDVLLRAGAVHGMKLEAGLARDVRERHGRALWLVSSAPPRRVDVAHTQASAPQDRTVRATTLITDGAPCRTRVSVTALYASRCARLSSCCPTRGPSARYRCASVASRARGLLQ